MTDSWLTDENGNRASIEYFGSREAAQKALDSLVNCKNCDDCVDCEDCEDCRSQKNKTNLCQDRLAETAVPVIENIHTQVYEACRKPEALYMGDWHTCETTHCRAGWVVTLAGEAGAALEEETSTDFAAMQIYRASDPENPVSQRRFYDSADKALADMKRLAEIERAKLNEGQPND